MTKHKVLQTTVYSSLQKALTLSLLSGLTASVLLVASSFTNVSSPDSNRTAISFFASRPAAAQQISPQLRQYFLSNPLESSPRDPFLPTTKIDRPLSPLELSALEDNLDRLNNTAQRLLAEGRTDEAFLLWRRELRLRRVLGPVEEFNTISRVAQLAWDAQRPVEVQLLTLRTREIWETLRAALGVAEEEEVFDDIDEEDGSEPPRVLVSGRTESDIATLNALAQVFTTLRDVDSAADVYSQVVELSRRSNNDPTVQRQQLAELHLQWFEFADAAAIYLDLLKSARESNNQTQAAIYLERLIYSYQQADEVAFAARAQTELLALYQAQGEEEELARLLLATAKNYRLLNLPKNAITYYRAAYSAAQRFDQFSYSAEVLQDLGSLYEVLALNDQALGAYNLLVPVEQQAYNDYGVMNAYDSIGKLQRRIGNSFEALIAFEQALVIANRLGLDENYFVEQIESVT